MSVCLYLFISCVFFLQNNAYNKTQFFQKKIFYERFFWNFSKKLKIILNFYFKFFFSFFLFFYYFYYFFFLFFSSERILNKMLTKRINFERVICLW